MTAATVPCALGHRCCSLLLFSLQKVLLVAGTPSFKGFCLYVLRLLGDTSSLANTFF